VNPKTLGSGLLLLLILVSACSPSAPIAAGPVTDAQLTLAPSTATLSSVAPSTTAVASVASTVPSQEIHHPGHYLIADSPIGRRTLGVLNQVPEFQGVSVVYDWVELESDKGVYDFSRILSDLDVVRPLGKQMTIMIRDKSFGNNQFVPVPDYLLTDEYSGGFATVPGKVSVAKRWEPAVSGRFRELIRAMGAELSGVAEIEGIKTSESALGPKPGADFTMRKYADQLNLDADALAEAFPGKANFLYLNWGLNGRNDSGVSLMREVATHAAVVGVGIGGPDVHPDVDIPAYPLYPLVSATVPTMIEVQYSDYDHVSPAGDTEQLFDFAVNTLGVSYIAWQERKPFIDAMIATVRAHPLQISQ